jgi:hypothetical protein
MTTTHRYSSTDAGAPTLTGEVGSLISLLKTCLVGSAGIAYGSKTPAGWTTAFEDAGANKIAFRNSLAAGGTGCYVRILDDGSGTSATAAHAHINAYSAMTDIDTGSDATPAPVTGWPGGRIEKSLSASATAYPWELVADELTFYLNTVANSTSQSIIYGAGDFSSNVLPDAYRVFVAAGAASTTNADRACSITLPSTINASSGRIALMRDHVGTPGAASCGVYGYASAVSAYGGSSSPFAYSGAYANENQICEALLSSSAGIRGSIRGLYLPMQKTHGETLPQVVSGTDAGSQFLMLRGNTSITSNDGYMGAVLIESVNPWPL